MVTRVCRYAAFGRSDAHLRTVRGKLAAGKPLSTASASSGMTADDHLVGMEVVVS